MKKILLTGFAIIVFIASTINAKPGIGVSFNFFYSSLRPYGSWVQLDNDIVAWHPHRIHRDWRPYSLGRWNWTNNGWYWDSDEPFGWATYHYGRWYLDDYYGWIWIPDYEWAPSWVEWRYNDDYIGWAPLPPYASFSINLGLHFSISWNAGYRWWNFVSYNRFCDSRLYHHLLDYRYSRNVWGSTKYRNNLFYDRDRIVNGGVDRGFIEKRGGYRISEREIRTIDNRNDFERSRGRDGDRIIAYRPSEKDIERNSRTEKYEISRGDRSSSMDRERISTPRFMERSTSVEGRSNENNERNLQRDIENRNNEIRTQRNAERQNSEREITRPREREIERPQIERREEPSNRRMEAERRTEQPERRIERREERSSERPSFRSESSRSERSNENRSSRESRGSDERRR